jgi:hypothetical protein
MRWRAADGALIVPTGQITNIKGMVMLPFVWSGTLPATGATDMVLADFATGQGQPRITFAFEVVGLSVSLSAGRTAGTLSVQAFNASTGGVLVGMAATIDGTNTNSLSVAKTPTGSPDIGGGSLMRMRMTTAGFAPLVENVLVMVWCAVQS